MPIEIKELHIKAVIGSRDKHPDNSVKLEDINRLKKEIVNEVMTKILRILRQKNER